MAAAGVATLAGATAPPVTSGVTVGVVMIGDEAAVAGALPTTCHGEASVRCGSSVGSSACVHHFAW